MNARDTRTTNVLSIRLPIRVVEAIDRDIKQRNLPVSRSAWIERSILASLARIEQVTEKAK